MTSIAIGLLSIGGHRELFQMIPEHVKRTWNEWALQGLVFVSVASQILLFLLGNLRKYNPRTRIRITLWLSYLFANTVASAALGVITRTALDVCTTHSRSTSPERRLNTSELMSFWAPFFLLHLGGPDTITAYSLEDNELWLRHLVELVFQSGVALYILLLSWPGCSRLPLLSIVVYIAGFIKCYERIQALRLANTENLRDSMLGSPDPGPNYPKIVEDQYQWKTSQGYVVDIEDVSYGPPLAKVHSYPVEEGKVISKAYNQFQSFKRLFVDLILTFEDRDNSRPYFRQLKSGKAFEAVEIELGFAYDFFYTKANVVYTCSGFVLRFTSVVLAVSVLVGFVFLCDIDYYRPIDIAITYLLIATAIVMEIFAAITMLRSDWADHWLSQHNHTREFLKFSFLKHPIKRRWSNTIAQLDLISLALEEKPARFLKAEKFFGVDKHHVNHLYKTYSKVSDSLKDIIYDKFSEYTDSTSDPKALCSHKGSFSLGNNGCDDLLWSITEVEFDQSILIWHIATALCYYLDLDDKDKDKDKDKDDSMDVCIESKHISDYMLHLLMTYPNMLPIGIGMIRCRDTCAEATRFFKERGINEKVEACRKLLEVDCTLSPSKVKGDRSKAVLFYGCRVALTLRMMERERMWKVVSEVWIEILAYAATHCRGVHHEQQLRRGGEFLSHVWLLMAHLGITEQFQVYQGHARARFNAS